MKDIISGALVMGYCVAALHFLRFWKGTQDRLFLVFGIAFFLLAVQRLALSLTPDAASYAISFYGLRLTAFLLILGAIVDKNRAGG